MLARRSAILVTNADLLEIERRLRDRGDTQFLSGIANLTNDRLPPIDTLAIDPGETRGRAWICYLSQSGRAPRVVLQVESPVKTTVAVDKSELVELWRSYVADGAIGYGNVYYSAKFSELNGVLREKDAEFVKWARSVVATIKRSMKFDKELNAHVGTDARQRIADGRLRVLRR
jgi:hypothetical protein